MDKILIKAYDEYHNFIGEGYAFNEQDLEEAKRFLREKAKGHDLTLEIETIRNFTEEDEKEVNDLLRGRAECIKYQKTEEAYEDILDQYDDGTINVTEAINRINTLYEDENERACRIRHLLNRNEDDYDDDYEDEENDEDWEDDDDEQDDEHPACEERNDGNCCQEHQNDSYQ